MGDGAACRGKDRAAHRGRRRWQNDSLISMHEKEKDGRWHQIMTTPGFIGKEGLGKEKEGDWKSPAGTFRFNKAFGIARDPGCAIPYTQVDKNTYWSGDQRPGMEYDRMVDIRNYPSLDKENSEHIIDYKEHYQYCLNINYNRLHIPGKGSALFMHCFGLNKPFTGGCIAVPKDKMRYVMKHVRPNCLIVIDSLEIWGENYKKSVIGERTYEKNNSSNRHRIYSCFVAVETGRRCGKRRTGLV